MHFTWTYQHFSFTMDWRRLIWLVSVHQWHLSSSVNIVMCDPDFTSHYVFHYYMNLGVNFNCISIFFLCLRVLKYTGINVVYRSILFEESLKDILYIKCFKNYVFPIMFSLLLVIFDRKSVKSFQLNWQYVWLHLAPLPHLPHTHIEINKTVEYRCLKLFHLFCLLRVNRLYVLHIAYILYN